MRDSVAARFQRLRHLHDDEVLDPRQATCFSRDAHALAAIFAITEIV